MGASPLTGADIEKSMIRDDLEFALSVAKENPVLSFQLLPYICLVALEAAGYLGIHVHNERLSSIRAKAKFLDNTKIDVEKTLDLLRQTRMDHLQHFLGLHKWWQFLARAMQPDMGECRFNGRFLGTTHLFNYYVSSSSKAATVKELGDGEMLNVAFQAGKVLGEIIDSGKIGIDRSVVSIEIRDDSELKGTDYLSRRYFAGKFGGNWQIDMIQHLQMFISMLNAVLYAIDHPAINRFSIFKIRYVTLFHVISSVRKLQSYFRNNGISSEQSNFVFKEISSDKTAKRILANKKFRNIIVHYKLLDLALPEGSSQNAYGIVEKAFSGTGYDEFNEEVCGKIESASTLLNDWMMGAKHS